MEPARRAAAAQPADGPAAAGQPAAGAGRNGPVPRAFAVRSPGTGRDDGMAG
jgi:hypothetical protein